MTKILQVSLMALFLFIVVGPIDFATAEYQNTLLSIDEATYEVKPVSPCRCAKCCTIDGIDDSLHCGGGQVCCKVSFDVKLCGTNPVILQNHYITAADP
ncbi:hypothetical protein Bhyg_02346, partial [Pseudolycoriella hygida]